MLMAWPYAAEVKLLCLATVLMFMVVLFKPNFLKYEKGYL